MVNFQKTTPINQNVGEIQNKTDHILLLALFCFVVVFCYDGR